MDDHATAPDEVRVVTLWPPTGWAWSPATSAVGVFVLTRLALLLAAAYGASATGVGSVSNLLSGWDGQHYLDLVAHGYPSHPDLSTYSEVAFLPGYPIVVRVVKTLFGLTPLGGALLVSFAAGILLVVTVVRLVSLVVDEDAGRRAGYVLALFPGSFVLSLPYAEALALLLTVGAFLAVERDRPWRAGVLGALATATSPVTIPLVVVLGVRGWRRRDARYLAAAALSSTGFVGYNLYLWHLTGNARAWFVEQTRGFGHHPSLTAPIDHLHFWPGIGLTETLSLVVLVLGFVALRRIRAPLEWTLYAALVMGVVIFDSGTWANPRFLLNAFPLVLALGVGARRGAYQVLTWTFALLLCVVFLAYMTIGSVTAQP